MKIWITKYALSRGILVLDVASDAVTEGYLWCRLPGALMNDSFEPKEWADSWEGALARAEKMRRDKIASLRKQIMKLEKTTFSEGGE